MHRCLFLLLTVTTLASAQQKPRARELGVPFSGTPGPLNAITDVPGVEVGQVTLISGEGKLHVGRGPVRTGVTAVLPRGRDGTDPVFAGWFTLNGNGEMTGTTFLDEAGTLYGPVAITNTMSVGVVRDAVISWALRRGADGFDWSLPVVAETWDGPLNDIAGMHIRPEHVTQALSGARSGPVAEGVVGGGTGMICFGFKGGIGTASRRLPAEQGGYTVGVLAQCNFGRRQRLTILGTPIGAEVREPRSCLEIADPTQEELQGLRRCEQRRGGADAAERPGRSGSVIIVIATDAPVLPHQLKRIARRASLAVGRLGGLGEESSGDIFIAFSTRPAGTSTDSLPVQVQMLPYGKLNPLFQATVEAAEEAVVNTLFAAVTTTGADGFRVPALPTEQVLALLRKAGRIR